MKVSDALFCILDTETTGVEPATDRVVEVAAVCYSYQHGLECSKFSGLVNPEREIPPQASAVHHIVDADVAGAPTLERLSPELLAFVGGATPVAHNAAFDSAFLPRVAGPWLCTMRLAQHLWKDAPAYNSQTLRYWLPGGVDVARGEASHRALADCKVTAFVLSRLIGAYLQSGHPDDVETLIAFAAAPVPITIYPFKKHKGQLIANVPSSDLNYWLYKADPPIDGDLRVAFLAELKRRSEIA